MSRAAALLELLLAEDFCCIGEIRVVRVGRGLLLHHRDDEEVNGLTTYRLADDAFEIARHDDAGKFRPLKAAPNLRHGWKLLLDGYDAAERAMELFYPGRLAALTAFRARQLQTTPLRDTLERQSGMYRVAAQAADAQLDETVREFCRSDGGCLRTLLWKRDNAGAVASTALPSQKFDPTHDQTGRGERAIPLLCQEACNLLVGAIRSAVKHDR